MTFAPTASTASIAPIHVLGSMASFASPPELYGIRLEFFLFALVLLGVAIFHAHTLRVALGGLALILACRWTFTTFDLSEHIFGSSGGAHGEGEWKLLLNLLGLLLGFTLLAKQFEESRLPQLLPAGLPNGAWGNACLLGLVFVMSAFLDNIAAAMIGGTIAKVVYRGRVHLGFLAAMVAASNAGGAGSVVGDTTTTMIWIEGAAWTDVLDAFIAAGAALVVLAVFAARQQHAFAPITNDAPPGIELDHGRLLVVALMLAGAIATNVLLDFPALGPWIAIAVCAPFRSMAWHELRTACTGSLFLLSLVMSASLMPVEELPAPSWQTTLGLGFISSVFDNIPLTKLALDQGGYDLGLLAYAVGVGGSMTWFGSSAGVAVASLFPQARSVVGWLRAGWYVPVAFVAGFAALYLSLGWEPKDLRGSHGVDRSDMIVPRDQ